MAVFEIPSYRLAQCTITPLESVGRSRIGRGTSLAITETMDTVFRVEIETIPLNDTDRAAWRAWRARLRGGLDQFTLYDISKATPLNYPNATTPASISAGWTGTATVTSLGASGALGLSALPANYVLTQGDYIALEEGGRIDLYQVATTITANGSGVVTVSVRPFLRTGLFTTAAVARLWQPKGVYVIEPESWSETTSPLPNTPISFSGIQRI